ncbi:transcription factor HES-2-like [Homalodisca vitripennis]|uniref:transcription factor HES-2-like n=1 Tax=Homalodisca vitripennis TaxID=197043 RepID=UPI001EECB604|nr:transcription factor HES-2-like [Homalodisca vitripennis]
MEKKRRARINHSLNELKRLITEASTKEGAKAKAAKLEKADILEMAVKHVQYLHDKYKVAQQKENQRIPAVSKPICEERPLPSILPKGLTSAQERLRVKGVTKLPSGEIALVIASERTSQPPQTEPPRLMWRPW